MIRDLIRSSARSRPAAPAILGPASATLTYADLDAAMDRYGATLGGLGVTAGDTIALVHSNGVGNALAFLGIAAHAACAPLNPAYRESELEFYLADLRPAAVAVEAGLDSPARGVASALGLPTLELSVDALTGPTIRAPRSIPSPRPGDVALLLHTSGTTSRPKLVSLTQANLAASARHIAEALQLTPADRCLNVMPLFHVHGLAAALLASLASGASVVCCPGFVAPRFFEWVEEFHPTWYTAVPTIHQSILARAPDYQAVIDGNRFRFIRSCSSALAPAVARRMEEVFRAPVIEAYGMTEAAHQMTSNPLPPAARKFGSVGVAAGPQVAVMNEAGTLVPTGVPGEIVIRGPNVTAGYAQNPDANAKAFTDGWFRTGDEGRLDPEGYLFITGRLKEIINRGGEKIAPREIDDVLLAHPAVAQAVAFAVPDASLGEAVAAAVVPRPGHSCTERELREFAGTRLAAFKVPAQILFLQEIPKGATGKIQRVGLAEKLGITEITRPVAAAAFVPPRSERERRIAAVFAETLGAPRVGIHDTVFDLGADSLLVTMLLVALEHATGVDVPVFDFLECPTVDGVCRWLDEHATRGARPRTTNLRVMIRPTGAEPPLFCVPGSYGDIGGFFNLARRLPREQPLIAFRLPEVGDGRGAYRVEDLAARYVEEIVAIRPEGPCHLAGVCMGGFVAYEIALQLSRRGRSVGVVALLDCYNHAYGAGVGWPERMRYRLRLLRKRMLHQTRAVRHARARSAPGHLRARAAALWATVAERAEERAHGLALRAGVALPRRLMSPRLAIRHAAFRYAPAEWSGSLELFRAEEPRVEGYDYPDMGWRGLARGGIAVHDVPGSHRTMLAEPNVEVVATALRARLRESTVVAIACAE